MKGGAVVDLIAEIVILCLMAWLMQYWWDFVIELCPGAVKQGLVIDKLKYSTALVICLSTSVLFNGFCILARLKGTRHND